MQDVQNVQNGFKRIFPTVPRQFGLTIFEQLHKFMNFKDNYVNPNRSFISFFDFFYYGFQL